MLGIWLTFNCLSLFIPPSPTLRNMRNESDKNIHMKNLKKNCLRQDLFASSKQRREKKTNLGTHSDKSGSTWTSSVLMENQIYLRQDIVGSIAKASKFQSKIRYWVNRRLDEIVRILEKWDDENQRLRISSSRLKHVCWMLWRGDCRETVECERCAWLYYCFVLSRQESGIGDVGYVLLPPRDKSVWRVRYATSSSFPASWHSERRLDDDDDDVHAVEVHSDGSEV